MMRITQQERGEMITFKLEGCLAGAWVDEMRRCWDEVMNTARARVIRIDLTEVTFIDVAGKKLLAGMFAAGAIAAAANVMTKAVIDELTCNRQTNPHRQNKRKIKEKS